MSFGVLVLSLVYKELLEIYGGDNWRLQRRSETVLRRTHLDLVVYDVNESVLCFMGELILFHARTGSRLSLSVSY